MGETTEIGVADLLSVLARRRHSGRLSIVTEGEEAQIYLDDGAVVLVNSSNHELRLGRVLLRLGLLDAARLASALRAQDDQGERRPLGQILVDAGHVLAEDLALAGEEQCIETLTQVIVSRSGTFMFNRDAKPRAKGLVTLNVERIVLEASRRADEMMTLRSLLPAPSTRLMVASRKAAEVSDQFTDLERQVLMALMPRGGTLADLARSVATDEVSRWRTVVSLRERGLIVTDDVDLSADSDEPEDVDDSVQIRTIDEIFQLSRDSANVVFSRIPTLAEVRAGSMAGTQMVAAITVVVREVIAAFNAGLINLAYANFSDDHFRRRGPLADDELDRMLAPTHPLRAEDQETFLAVRNVRLLQDGRVSAILMTHMPRMGETKKLLIFVRGEGRWQIDAVIEAPGSITGQLQSSATT